MHGDMGLCMGIWVYVLGYVIMGLCMEVGLCMGIWVYVWGYGFLCTGIVGSNNSIRLTMYIGLMNRGICLMDMG